MTPEVQTLMSINRMPDGTISVSGPLHDKVQSYGLLALAQDAVRNFQAPAGPQLLVTNRLPGQG